MIYTLTVNPSLDYMIKLDALRIGEIQRTSEEEIIYGGKGINVSRMLQHLDCRRSLMALSEEKVRRCMYRA